MGRGSNEGRWEKTREGESDDAVSLKIAPPPYPFCPPTHPSTLPLRDPSVFFLHHLIISLLNEKGCSSRERGWGVAVLLHTSFVPWREECLRRKTDQRAERQEGDGGRARKKMKGSACLLTNCSRMPVHISSLEHVGSYRYLLTLSLELACFFKTL